MRYTIRIGNIAKKQFRKLPENIANLLRKKIISLSLNPKPIGYRKIVGEKNLFRIRQGNYRIIYSVDKGELIIMILSVGHRGNVYRDI